MNRKLISVFVFFIFYFTFAYADNSNEYNFSLDFLRALHYCQWAFVYEGERGDSQIAIEYDLMSANYKLREAKSKLFKYMNDKNQAIKEISEEMVTGIDGLLERNNRLLGALHRTNNLELRLSKDSEDELEEIRSQKTGGLQKIRASASKLFNLTVDSENNKQTGSIKFKIMKKQRLELLKKLNELFEGLLKWHNFNVTLAKDKVKCDADIKNWLIFDLNKLRDSFTIDTYEEAKARGLLTFFD